MRVPATDLHTLLSSIACRLAPRTLSVQAGSRGHLRASPRQACPHRRLSSSIPKDEAAGAGGRAGEAAADSRAEEHQQAGVATGAVPLNRYTYLLGIRVIASHKTSRVTHPKL